MRANRNTYEFGRRRTKFVGLCYLMLSGAFAVRKARDMASKPDPSFTRSLEKSILSSCMYLELKVHFNLYRRYVTLHTMHFVDILFSIGYSVTV